MKGILTFFLFLFLFLFLAPASKAGHYVYGAKMEYRFVHADSLEIILTIKTNCSGWGGVDGGAGASEKQYYYAQLLHIVRQQDTLLDSLDYCNSYLNNSICPDTMSRCLDGPLFFSTAIFEYKKVFPLSYFAECELTFYWQEETNQSTLPGPGRTGFMSTGLGNVPVYVYAYLNHCHIAQPNSPLVTRDFPDVLPRNLPINYRYSVSVDEPEDDSVYIDLIEPKTTNGVDTSYSANYRYNRPIRFLGFPNPSLSLPAGFHLDPVCGILSFTGTQANEVSTINVRIQRFVRRNDSVFKVSEINYDHALWIVGNNDYKYYFPTPSVYNDQLCIEKSVYVPIVCRSGLPREPGPQKICTRDSVFLETPFNANYVYQWYKDGVLIPSANQSGYWANDSGSYRVAVANEETGCAKFSITMVVLIDDGTIPVITYDSLRPYCESDTAFIQRDSTADFSWIQWRRDNKPFSLDTTFVFPAVTNGAYALDVINERGCRVRSNTLNLKFNAPVVAPLFDTSVHTFCGAFSDTLHTERPLFEYKWIQPYASSDSFLIVDSNAMVHLEGLDTLGCPVKDSILVVSFPFPVSELQEDTAFCWSDSIEHFLYAQKNPGNKVRYVWNQSPADSLHRFLAKDSGLFFVRITDSTTCATIDSVRLLRAPVLPVALPDDWYFCPGQAVSKLLMSPLKDSLELRFLWNTGPLDTLGLVEVYDTGTYILQVLDSATCRHSDTIVVDYRPEIAVDLGPDSMYCFDAAIAQLLQSGANRPEYQYAWNGMGMDIVPTHLASDSGMYWVDVIDTFGCAHSDSLLIGRYAPIFLDLGKDTVLCLDSVLLLDAGEQEAYIWSDGSQTRQLLVAQDGDYWVEVKDSVCVLRDSIRVDFSSLPLIDLPDSVLCEIESLLLEVDSSYPEYLWSSGRRSYQAELQDTGLIWVRVTNGCGTTTDSAWLRGCRYEPLEIYIPSAFTPNGDGHNPVFKIYIDHYREFNLTLYNRWGERIFESDTPDRSWDGTFRGELVQQEVYFYVIRVISLDKKMYAYYGNVTVLR